MKTMNSPPLLPEETVCEILRWLPVKSLCRFKCVSKRWLSTISAPKFAISHFSRSKTRPKILIDISCESFPQSDEQGPHWPKEEFQYFFIADPGAAAEQLTHQMQIPVKKRPFFKTMTGDSMSVAGLTLGLDSRESIRIVNPSTKSHVIIPRSLPKSSFPKGGPFHKRGRFVSIGFDPVNSKYKVLEFHSLVDRWNCRVMAMEYRVVTVGDYGNWRSVEDGPLINLISKPKQELSVNGVIYYIADVIFTIHKESTWEEVRQCMVAFDVRSEKFQVVKLDNINGRINNNLKPWQLMEFEGKVAIVDYSFQKLVFDILVLEDFENQVWSLRYSGLPSPMKTDKYKLVGTTSSGVLVFARVWDFSDEVEEKDVPFSLFFFDPKTEDFWSREFRLPPGFDMIGEVKISVMGHVETLMSLT